MQVGVALATLSLVAMAGVAADTAGSQPVETAVAAAVKDFDPLWSPPAGQLRGWVIGIDPGGAGGEQPDQRRRADLGLITATYLYHFVLAAGGSPVLTRADDTEAASENRSDWERRVDAVRQAECSLCVSIRYVEASGPPVVRGAAAGLRPNDARLVESLAAALGVEPAGPGGRGSAEVSFVEALAQADGVDRMAVGEVCLGCSLQDSTIGAALRKSSFDNARRLYAGISRYCKGAEHPAPSAAPSPKPDTPSSNASGRLQNLGRSIWPQGKLPDERIDWFCRRFAGMSITNHSLVYFEVSAGREQEAVTLRGRTNTPRVVNGLREALRAVGVEQVRSQVQTLPDRKRLGQHLFGVCRAPMALTYDRPGNGGGLQTQLLFGEPLFLLDRDGEHYLLHAGDGYWGWVRGEAIQPMTAEQFDEYMGRPRGAVLEDIDQPRIRIPRGSSVRVVRATKDDRVILLPDGTMLTVPAAAVTMHEPEGSQAGLRVRAALDLLYVPYVFGGCSPLGLDCSGLVTNVWSQAGHKPPRDAWQQASAGRLVATSWHRTGIRAGDQMFFINECGKVHHTGVALDAVRVLHCAPPCVQIGSLDPRDPLYDPQLDHNFFLAKRP